MMKRLFLACLFCSWALLRAMDERAAIFENGVSENSLMAEFCEEVRQNVGAIFAYTCARCANIDKAPIDGIGQTIDGEVEYFNARAKDLGYFRLRSLCEVFARWRGDLAEAVRAGLNCSAQEIRVPALIFEGAEIIAAYERLMLKQTLNSVARDWSSQ